MPETEVEMKSARMLLGAFLAVGTMAAVFACGSSDDEAGGGGGAADGKSLFVSKVNAQLIADCGKCHQQASRGAPVFLGASPEASYTAIEGFPGLISAPSLSPLVQKGVHSGPALTQAQTELVTQWLTQEVKARKLQNDPGSPKNLRAAFKAFGDCMDYNRWKELKLHQIARVPTENNQGLCSSCHNLGQASYWAIGGLDNPQNESDNALTFIKMRQFPFVQRLVIGRVNAEGAFEGVEPARRLIEKGTEARQLQANQHPSYSIPSELAQNLQTYVLETISNVNAGRCAGASLPDAGLYDAALLPR